MSHIINIVQEREEQAGRITSFLKTAKTFLKTCYHISKLLISWVNVKEFFFEQDSMTDRQTDSMTNLNLRTTIFNELIETSCELHSTPEHSCNNVIRNLNSWLCRTAI